MQTEKNEGFVGPQLQFISLTSVHLSFFLQGSEGFPVRRTIKCYQDTTVHEQHSIQGANKLQSGQSQQEREEGREEQNWPNQKGKSN